MRLQDQQQQQSSRVFYELSVLILNILRSPPSPMQLADHSPASVTSSRRAPTTAGVPQITAGGLASLLLGMSLALMLCGWLTFMIGFILMPWVLGFYFLGIVSSLSMLGRAFLSHTSSSSSSSSSSPKDVPAWKLL